MDASAFSFKATRRGGQHAKGDKQVNKMQIRCSEIQVLLIIPKTSRLLPLEAVKGRFYPCEQCSDNLKEI